MGEEVIASIELQIKPALAGFFMRKYVLMFANLCVSLRNGGFKNEGT